MVALLKHLSYNYESKLWAKNVSNDGLGNETCQTKYVITADKEAFEGCLLIDCSFHTKLQVQFSY